jgi:hypothetical protein
MNESVAVTKVADTQKDSSPTKSDNSSHRAQNEPEMQLGSLRGVINTIRLDGGTPSVDSIATQLSNMTSTGRASVLQALQQTQGNLYVQQVVLGVQAKLMVGQPNDRYEQEADRVADAVMRMSEPQVQRQPEEEEEEDEELVQTKTIADQNTPVVQRQVEEAEEEEEELIQPKPLAEQITTLVQRQPEGVVVQSKSENSVTSSYSGRYVHRVAAWIQAKLKPGPPNDRYEQEADRVADTVMRTSEPEVQRQLEEEEEKKEEEEEELIQSKPLAEQITPLVQRQTEGELVQSKSEKSVSSSYPGRYVHRVAAWVQAKLKPGPPNDRYEQEADRVADMVMRMSEPEVQRQLEGEEELVQTKTIANQITPVVQRQVEEEEEVVQSKSANSVASSDHASMMDSAARGIHTSGSGGVMNQSTRRMLESRMGMDLSNVRVHTDGIAHQACADLNARAFTHKNHIWLGRGQSQDDLRLMAHETTHVLQQGGIARRKPAETVENVDLVQTLPLSGTEQTTIPRETTPASQTPTPAAPTAAPAERGTSRTSPATETATSAPVEVTQARAGTTEGTAPEAAAAPGVATTAAVAGVAPEDQERLQGVMERLEVAATQQEGPAASSASQQQASEQAASEASAAAPSPANEAAAMGQATQVETMNEQDAGEVDQRSFLEIVRQRLQELERTLDNPEKMDEFREGGGASCLQAGLLQTANQQVGEAQSSIRSATEAEPAPTNERVPEQLRERAAPGRVSNLQAQEVLPQPRTESEVSLEESRQSVEEQLVEENLTEERLRRANDPRFTAVQEARETVNEHADNAPQAFREEEQTLLGEQEGAIVAEEATAAREMEQAQEQSQREIDTEQQTAMTEEERQRQEVSDHIESIYTSTQHTVEEKLNGLGEEVTRRFTEGEQRARQRFEEFVADGMTAWKLRRYGERAWIPVVGLLLAAGTWVYDKFRGINEFPEVKQIYENGKNRYIADLDVVIVGIANLVEETLAWCQNKIQSGRDKIQEYLERLPESLREVGEQTSSRVSERFDELRDNVEERRNSLADQLVESYRQAREALDQRIEAMQAENRGLVNQFMDRLRGVLEAIRNFRDRLMSIIGEAGDVIELILEDPIGFLENLLEALKGGFRQFSSNIWEHLRRGLMGWLFGTLATAGVTIPSEFSLRSVIGLILQILGITYDRIRAKVARIIGERNVAILERVWGYVSTLIREGPIGLWEQIREDLGNLKDVVIEGIKQWVITRIITAAVTRLVSMFNPAGAIIQAVLAIYNTVMFFIERINQIMDLVQSIVRSLGAIVRGNISAAANLVERTMGLTLPVIISFLARLIGLGGISGTISRIIGRVRRRVDRAIDRGLRRIVRRIRGMLRRGGAGTAAQRLDRALTAAQAAVNRFAGRRVGRAVLRPLLGAIRIRYRLRSLEVVPRRQNWAVHGAASPGEERPTDAQVEEGNTTDLEKLHRKAKKIYDKLETVQINQEYLDDAEYSRASNEIYALVNSAKTGGHSITGFHIARSLNKDQIAILKASKEKANQHIKLLEVFHTKASDAIDKLKREQNRVQRRYQVPAGTRKLIESWAKEIRVDPDQLREYVNKKHRGVKKKGLERLLSRITPQIIEEYFKNRGYG